MKIKNFEIAATTEARKNILTIAEAGLQAIDPDTVIKKMVVLEGDMLRVAGTEIDLSVIDRVFVVGVGKCSLFCALAIEGILGSVIDDGIVADVRSEELKYIKTFKADHPMPTENNVVITGKIMQLLSSAGSNDLVIFIISGGGSTMLCQPQGITSFDEAKILHSLFNAGADIYEINTIRKHLSLARGGHLAKIAYPARVISLIFSDVPGDGMEFVSSGPTMKDTTTVRDAEQILMKYNIRAAANAPGLSLIETVKDEKYFEKVVNILAVSNRNALQAMQDEAQALGFSVIIKHHSISGEVQGAVRGILHDIANAPSHTAHLYGGELTVSLGDHPGKGGRSLEFALAALQYAAPDTIALSFSSDGRDNTDFAGAISDQLSKRHGEEQKLSVSEYLKNHNTYDFFKKTGDYIVTGVTGSNVSDLIIALKM